MGESKKNYDREASEERIKKAALSLFAKKGFNGTTTRMIAEKADTNLALISRYFGSKEELFKTLVQERLQSIMSQQLHYPPQNSFKDEASKYIEHVIESVHRNLKFFKLVIREAMNAQEYSKVIKNINPQTDQQFIERLELLKQKDLLTKNISSEDLHNIFQMVVSGVIIKKMIIQGQSRKNVEPDMECFLNFIIQTCSLKP